MKKYTVIDEKTGREVAQVGPVDARLWTRVAAKAGRPVRIERTEPCQACGLHRCGGGKCAES